MSAGSASPRQVGGPGTAGPHADPAAPPAHWTRRRWPRCVAIGPTGGGARLAFHLQPGSDNDQLLIGVLGQLRRFLHGQKATLLGTGCLPSQPPRQALVASQRGWLVVERLPGYAPS
jgi:hypothetical protein